MQPVSSVDSKVRDNLLTEAGARNLAAEIVVVRGENLQANLKSRFLRVQPERVLLEVPTHNARPVVLQTGQFVEVYFKVGHERFGFDSRVVGYSRVEMNGQCVVDAIDVAPPLTLEPRQRRKFYRVSVASLPALAAKLWPIEADPEQGDSIAARLCNLSAGGVAILVDRDRWQFTSEHKYRLRFSLPAEDAEYEFVAVVCHVRHVFHSRRQIIGLAFLPGDDSASHRDSIERIAQFVSDRQHDDVFRSAGATEATVM
ncbi:MAG: PilZ domain-containing protein [Phycisphaerae bacterium]|nr:PilZ domain-containing protein [Phycisphaerae bacterium]